VTRQASQTKRLDALQIEFQRRPVYDEFHTLYQRKLARAPEEKRFEELTEIIRDWYEDLPADQSALAEGNHCVVQIPAKTIEKTWLSMKAIYAKIGPAKFLAICSVTFKALSGLIGNDAAAELQVEARTGSRKLKSVALAPGKPQDAA